MCLQKPLKLEIWLWSRKVNSLLGNPWKHTRVYATFLLSLSSVLTSVCKSGSPPLRYQRRFPWTRPALSAAEVSGELLWLLQEAQYCTLYFHCHPMSLTRGRRSWQCSVTPQANALGSPRVPKLLLWGMRPSKHEFIKPFHEVPVSSGLSEQWKNQRWVL